MHQPFKKRLLSSCIAAFAASALSAPGFAQDGVEEIVVSGVRGAQEKAIDIKRNSAEVVDSVLAEDIGKLPDVTIADSLQRVTGIQISRKAGQEGGEVSIRGMKQVLATLNGETFLTAKALTGNGADFTDIPSSLVSGMTVYKSQSATNLEGGVGGAIDLQTKRSLKLKDGFTVVGTAKASSGSESSGTDPDVNALFGWKISDTLATSLAVSYNDSTLTDNRGFMDPDLAVESSWGCPSTGCADLNGDGKLSSEIIEGASWDSNIQSRQTERERLGVNYNFNAMLSDSLELNADVVYNKIDEKSAGQFLYLTNGTDRGQFHNLTDAFPKAGLHDASLAGRSYYATELNTLINGLRAGVMGDYRKSDALNTNLELKYDNGGAFTGSTRWVHGTADSNNNTLTFAQVTYGRKVVRAPNGTAVEINPGAIDNGNIYKSHLQLNDESIGFTIDPALANLAKATSAWYIHSAWIDGGKQNADSDVVRADGNFKFADKGFTSMDFGLRFSDRSTTNESLSFFSPSGYMKDGVNLLNKYHEAGYAVGQAGNFGGTAYGATYDPLPVFGLDDTKLSKYLTTVSNFGKAGSGISLNVPMIDVNKINDPVAFENYLYGKGEQILNPDRSYKVGEKKQSVFVKFNFDADFSDDVSMTGNAGMRYVKTDLEVTRNLVDPSKLNPRILAGTDPNHTTYLDLGDEVTDVSYNHALSSFNTTFNLGEEWKVKAAYNETMSLQNLDSLGQGSITYFKGEQVDPVTGQKETFQRVNSRNNNGNPNLKPWEAGTFSLAGEWYPNETSLISLGYFNMRIDSFTFNDSKFNANLADSDGTVRDGAVEYTVSNGKGGVISGYEFSWQQSLTFLPGFLSNTGITFNYTYSPSKGSQKLANGDRAPFSNTAENQSNLVLWYQGEKFQARIAGNYLSKQYQGQNNHWTINNPNGLDQWLKPQMFVDVSGSYDVSDAIQVSLAINNLTEENSIQYTGWEDNISQYDLYERRVTAGVTAKF